MKNRVSVRVVRDGDEREGSAKRIGEPSESRELKMEREKEVMEVMDRKRSGRGFRRANELDNRCPSVFVYNVLSSLDRVLRIAMHVRI